MPLVCVKVDPKGLTGEEEKSKNVDIEDGSKDKTTKHEVQLQLEKEAIKELQREAELANLRRQQEKLRSEKASPFHDNQLQSKAMQRNNPNNTYYHPSQSPKANV